MPRYKNNTQKIVDYGPFIRVNPGDEIEVDKFLPPNVNLVLTSNDPLPNSEILLSKDVSGATMIEVVKDCDLISSSYTVVLVVSEGIAKVHIGDPNKFYVAAVGAPMIRTFKTENAPVLNFFGTYKGAVTITY